MLPCSARQFTHQSPVLTPQTGRVATSPIRCLRRPPAPSHYQKCETSDLTSLAKSLEFMLLDRYGEWLAARREDLDYGDIDGIEAAVREFPLEGVKEATDRELGYFLNNAPRMRYKWFRSRGLFVGSGVVESGCKAVIGQRLKLSGMRWTVTGADAIATLRCQQASRPEDRIWRARHNQTIPA